MDKYFTRLIEKNIKEDLQTSGVVVIEGPKFVGKSTTASIFASSSFIIDTIEKRDFASTSSQVVLEGETPRLIDEWQYAPNLWNIARSIIDKRNNKFGQFIFTGSSTPIDKSSILHSGAGRIIKIQMFPLTLYESKESLGIVSLTDLFLKKDIKQFLNDNYSIKQTAFYICRGGWPLSITSKSESSIKITKNYTKTLFEFENSANNKFRNKKKELLNLVLKSYARNISTEVKKSTLIEDINKNDDRKINIVTFDSYSEALKDLYIIYDMESWNPNLRSKTATITTPTRHFVDTSIATSILNISPEDLLNDIKTFGLMFEDFVVKELKVYSQYIGGEIRHYRDSNGLECDAVIHLENGKYALIEIKLGGENAINQARNKLLSLKKKIIKSNKNEPSFMAIITASGPCFTNKEGIHIIPINTLKL